jgi:hypothetical protein
MSWVVPSYVPSSKGEVCWSPWAVLGSCEVRLRSEEGEPRFSKMTLYKDILDRRRILICTLHSRKPLVPCAKSYQTFATNCAQISPSDPPPSSPRAHDIHALVVLLFLSPRPLRERAQPAHAERPVVIRAGSAECARWSVGGWETRMGIGPGRGGCQERREEFGGVCLRLG